MALDDFLNDWIEYQRRQAVALEDISVILAKILALLEKS